MDLNELAKMIKQINEVLYSYPKNNVNGNYPQIFGTSSKRKEMNNYYKNMIKSFLFKRW